MRCGRWQDFNYPCRAKTRLAVSIPVAMGPKTGKALLPFIQCFKRRFPFQPFAYPSHGRDNIYTYGNIHHEHHEAHRYYDYIVPPGLGRRDARCGGPATPTYELD